MTAKRRYGIGAAGVRIGLGYFAMRDIFFGAAVTIIVLELALLMIGLDMTIGVAPSIFTFP
jgi:hypothetical protein